MIIRTQFAEELPFRAELVQNVWFALPKVRVRVIVRVRVRVRVKVRVRVRVTYLYHSNH
jgi:hypothetical protein